jgi:hypothetical protein
MISVSIPALAILGEKLSISYGIRPPGDDDHETGQEDNQVENGPAGKSSKVCSVSDPKISRNRSKPFRQQMCFSARLQCPRF